MRGDNAYKIDAAIVGAADCVSPTGKLDMPARQLEMKVIKEALENANLTLDDVDAIYCPDGSMPGLDLAEYLKIKPRICDSTFVGGAAYEVHVQHAAMALTLGECDVALIVHGGAPRYLPPGQKPVASGTFQPETEEWERPYGSGAPAPTYAMAARQHMHKYGTTSEQLAQIAVSTREWAMKNPKARHQTPLTIDDVLSSPMIADPLHRFDVCLFTDGGGAIVMTRRDRAKDLVDNPVYVIGAGSSQTHSFSSSQIPDLTVTPAAISAAAAMAQAGITHSDVDVIQTYDSFTITVLLCLEDMGFCKKGEGGAFVADGKLGPGGSLPTNTSGGGLSYTHPGQFGIFLLVEAARQLAGTAGARQVNNPKVAIAHASGGFLSCMSTVVMTNEEER